MRDPEKKFLIKAPVIGGDYFWCVAGRGYTDDPNRARKFGEKEALALKDKEPLLELIPV